MCHIFIYFTINLLLLLLFLLTSVIVDFMKLGLTLELEVLDVIGAATDQWCNIRRSLPTHAQCSSGASS